MTKQKDSMGAWPALKPVPDGYKRCSKCGDALLLSMFNRDKRRPDGHGYQCKACQKARSKQNYKKIQNKNNRKKRYKENIEDHREHSREYYANNKEAILAKQKEYHKTDAGKSVMSKAHTNRRELIKKNQGKPYTRYDIIKRDSVELIHPETDELVTVPVCGICGDPIWDDDMHLDHIKPISEGGLDCYDNMRCTHAKCNLSRPRKFDTKDRVIK